MLIVCAALSAVAVLPGCGGDDKPEAVKTVADYFPIKIGSREARLQIALTPPEMQRGLMERPSLGANDGMLFLYQRPQQMSFWMRNTLIPLDIGFFDAKGVLREVRQLYPHDERSVRSNSGDLQIAIEMNQDWYRNGGVGTGAQLDLEALKAALKARGAEPRRFGLE